MTIRLEKVIPLPMLEQERSSSGIWEASSVEFRPGTKTVVSAPSGRGKTTLLSIIYGLRRDYRGQVYIDGSEITEFSGNAWSALRKEKLSYIFQGLELFDELSARDNIRLKNNISGYKTENEITAMAEMLGMTGFLEKKTGILSFGQKQRVAVIRALCQPFGYLLADECFSHMDRDNRAAAWELISSECSKQGAGLILTSLNGREETEIEERMEL